MTNLIENLSRKLGIKGQSKIEPVTTDPIYRAEESVERSRQLLSQYLTEPANIEPGALPEVRRDMIGQLAQNVPDRIRIRLAELNATIGGRELIEHNENELPNNDKYLWYMQEVGAGLSDTEAKVVGQLFKQLAKMAPTITGVKGSQTEAMERLIEMTLITDTLPSGGLQSFSHLLFWSNSALRQLPILIREVDFLSQMRKKEATGQLAQAVEFRESGQEARVNKIIDILSDAVATTDVSKPDPETQAIVDEMQQAADAGTSRSSDINESAPQKKDLE